MLFWGKRKICKDLPAELIAIPLAERKALWVHLRGAPPEQPLIHSVDHGSGSPRVLQAQESPRCEDRTHSLIPFQTTWPFLLTTHTVDLRNGIKTGMSWRNSEEGQGIVCALDDSMPKLQVRQECWPWTPDAPPWYQLISPKPHLDCRRPALGLHVKGMGACAAGRDMDRRIYPVCMCPCYRNSKGFLSPTCCDPTRPRSGARYRDKFAMKPIWGISRAFVWTYAKGSIASEYRYLKIQKLERKVKRGYTEGERRPSLSLRGRDSNWIKVLVSLQLKKKTFKKVKHFKDF